jgi:AraC-like DNA-binding protein
MRYVARRRIERAQDLLRATNLTVTEVCHLVGYASLGTFSSRFRELVGCSPTDYQRRYAASGGGRIPGCVIFMLGLQPVSAISEKRIEPDSPSVDGTNQTGRATR